MPNSRTIPPEAYAHAREALFRYFASRYGRADADDLSQEVLCRLFEREDYEFDNPADFLRVCKGFARKVAQERFRAQSRYGSLDYDVPAPVHGANGQRDIEARVLLDQICRKGREGLRSADWRAICNAATLEETSTEGLPGRPATPRERIFLHRARAKLREIIERRSRV
jgi:DNA-directed RNA polymerase specialized sigma24 family protein